MGSSKSGSKKSSWCKTPYLLIWVVALLIAVPIIVFVARSPPATESSAQSEPKLINTQNPLMKPNPAVVPPLPPKAQAPPKNEGPIFTSSNTPCIPGDVTVKNPLPVRVKPGSLLTLNVCLNCAPNVVDLQVNEPYQYLWDSPITVGAAGPGCYTLNVMTPKLPGVYSLRFMLDTVSIQFDTDVTCSNGIFCDGTELYVNGKCVAGPLPCGLSNKGAINACKRYPCIESNKTCGLNPVGTNCPLCATSSTGVCTPSCEGKTCGDDGCGGSCGTCGDGNGCNVEGRCIAIGPGTCSNPYPLFFDDGGNYTVVGNSTPVSHNTSILPLPFGGIVKGYIGNELLDQVTPYCGLPGVPEVVYKFTLTQPSGYNILVKAAVDGDCQLDTLLAIHKYNDSAPLKCSENFATEVAVGSCADEGNPFAFCASRVFGRLDAGTYTIVMTVYDNTNSGEYLLNLNFNGLNERMECDAIKCGLDVHGTPCVFQDGDCADGKVCLSGKCELHYDDCLLNTGCGDRRCGPAPNCPSQLGCGALYSEACADESESCEKELGFCFLNDLKCDSLVPICRDPISPGQRAKSYCGSDCKWHEKTEVLADLVSIPLERVRRGITFINDYFTAESCTLIEGCTLAPGARQLIRFETSGVNQGLAASLDVNETDYRIYEYSQCHLHRHIDKFAQIHLYNTTNMLAATVGYKLGFCISDSAQFMTGPLIPCDPTYDCDDQGVTPGWTDEYPTDLPCQWLDITDVPRDRWYFFRQCLNYARLVTESDYENNCVTFPVWVPSFGPNEFIADYQQYLDDHPSIPPPPTIPSENSPVFAIVS